MGKDEEANQREEETDFFHLESRDGYLQRIDQPFLPNVEYRLNANNDVVGYDVTFNQAYIFNRVSSGQVQVKDERKISNMEEAHELEREHDIKYYVQVEIDPQNFKITDAQFTGYTPDCEEQTNFPHILFDQFDDDQQPFTGWFPVLRLEDGQVTDFTQRNNIFLSDRQFKQVGNSTTGEVGAAHILVESGRKTDDLPVRVRSISGAGIIEVTEFPDYILLSGEASGSSGDWSGENKGLGAQIYDEYTLNPAEFRTLTGAENIVITQGVNEIEIKSEDQICGSASDADWWAYVEDSKQPAKFRGLKAGSGVHFNADDDGCVTTIDVDTGCCTGMSGISVTTIYNTYNSNTNITYSSSDTSTIEFYGNGKELLKLDGDSEVVTIGSDQSGECVTAKIYGDYELLDCADGTKLSDSKKDSDGDGVSSTYDRDGNPSTEMGSNSSKEGSIKTYNAAGTQIINETSSDGAGNAVSKQRNSSNQVVNQTAASASTDTFFNAGGVAIGDNSTVAGKSLYVKGTTRIQDSSTAGDGTLEFGNDSTHSIGYATSKNALTVGAGVKRFDADHGEQIDLYSTNAASYSAQDGYIAASSPATGSAILAGSGNSISGHYNVITAGANNTISGKSMNFIGGGSGIDITDSEFSVSVGGRNNDISGANWSVIAGGYDNLISGKNTNSIGGGYSNEIRGVFASVIAGGYDNLVSGNLESAGAVVGGVNNKVEKSHYGFIGAGASNTIKEDSDGAVIVGGLGNTLNGTNSFIGGGQENAVSGTYGVALGSFAKVKHNGAFVFSDGTPATAFSSGDNTLLMSFKSGVYVQSNSGLYVNGNPVMTGASDLDTDTLQIVTDRGATTTNDVTVADLLVQNDGQVRANGNGSITLGNTNGGTIYVSGTSTKSIITPRVNHLYLQSNRDEDDIIFQAGEADVEIARFDSANQRFGIGKHNPQSRLHIGNATGSTLGLRFTNPTETVNQYFASDATDSDFFITYAGNGGAEITLQHDGKLALNASNGDNVGVGTDNPSEKLHVYGGDVRISDGTPVLTLHDTSSSALTTLTLDGVNTTLNNAGTNGSLIFSTESAEAMRIDEDGNVGIGTTTPRTTLHVSKAGATEGGILTIDNPNNTDGAYCGIEFINSTVGYPRSAIFAMRTGGYDAELTFHTSPTNEITGTDYPAATERMRIDHDGKVGIGTNDPSAQLTVSGDGIRIISTGTNAHNGEARIGVAGNNSRPNFELGPSNNSDEFQIINGGQWKVRTTNDVDLAFGVNSSDVIYIEGTNENVGIGTTSPQKAAHLYVDGNDGLRIQSSNNHAFTQIMAHTDYSAYIQFRDGANRYWIQSTTDDKLRFRPNATSLESATINFDATGNVGIGVLSPSQKLEVGTNTDVSAQIGVAHVGYMGFADHAGFAHLDNASTSNYSLLQSSAGDTFINSAASRHIYFRDGNATIGGFNGNDDFYVDTDTLYVDASADSVGINDSTPSYPLDVNGIIRTQSGLLGTQFGTGPCTTIDGFFASTSTEDYGFQNALLMNDLAGFTKWAGVTIATSGLYKTRGGSAGSYTYSNEAGTGDFDRAFQANNHTVGSWYTDSGPDGDITTGAASTGVIELYFNGVKSLNYSAQAAAIFGSASFRATHVKIEALRTGAWQTILDTTENTKTALIARIASNGGGANATTGLRYSFARAGNYFRINNLYAADYDLGNDLSYGGQYYIDKYYDGRHYSTLRPVIDGGSDLGTSSNRYGGSYVDYGRFTNAVGIGTDTLTYRLNVSSSDDVLAQFKSTDNKAGILIQDDDTAAYVSVENNILALGPQNGTNAAQNLNYNVTNYRLGIGTNVPDLPLHVKGTGIRLEESGAARHLDILPASAGINHKFTSDSTSAGYEFHNNAGNICSFGQTSSIFNQTVSVVSSNIHLNSSHYVRFGSDSYRIQGSNGSNYLRLYGGGNIGVNVDGSANVGIKNDNPQFELDVSGTIHGTSGNFENGITVNGNPVVTGTSAFESDTLQTVTDQGNTTTNAVTISGAVTLFNHIFKGVENSFLGLYGGTDTLTNDGFIKIHGNSSNWGKVQTNIGYDATNSKAHWTLNNTTELMTLKGNGRLGIGTTGPNQLLHVDGKTQLGTNGFTEGGLIINYASLSETKGGAATLLGNAVYAGTTNNTFRRTKGDAGNYILMTYNRGIAFHTNVTGNTSDDYSIDNHEQMRITTGGSVGIGTTEPAKTLDIDGDTRVKNAEFQVTSSSAYTTHLNYLDGGNNYISQANGGGTFFRNNGGTLVSISSVGTLNVGAAGVTNTRLHVTGAASDSLAKFKDGSDGVEITTRGASRQQIDFLGSNTSAINAKGSLFINYDSDNGGSNDTITFARNGVDEAGTVDMIIKEGNVGIGTTSPSYELDVVGTTRSTYYIGGAYLEENASSSKLKFYTDGTVLVMDEDGELKPCEKENDTLVFGVSKRDFDSPVVLGAEPILVTGPIKVGDYIVTSSKQGHGQAMKEQKLGTIIAQAMESGDGESYNIKAMIRKM